jgi:2-C-methyl-D-erythritol 2,4-cyclodiphosphate synthase
MRIGHGYDVHKLVEGRKCIIGGVDIPFSKGLLGHSDADVLVHAVMDAIIGALALGDIGHLFPDNDPTYEGANSLALCARVAEIMREKGYVIGNVDATVIAQAPKMAPFIGQMRENIAFVLNTDVENISVKATTEEKLGFTGEGLGISAHAVCLLIKN